NRRLVGVIADMHFAPTINNEKNLLNENVNPSDIYITGNTVIDALETTVRDDYEFKDENLKSMDWDNKKVIVMTAHRRENLGEPLENICKAVREVVETFDDVEVVYPVHMNPAVRDTAYKILGNHDRIRLIEPVNADELHNAIKRGYLVLTDSGGLQEEAPSLGKPVLVLRNETERPEAVDAGTVKILGVDKDTIITETSKLLTNMAEYEKMAKAVNPYGDGNASKRIVEAIIERLY
ncbi:MAG: UDP-N-acetylglucosamine 2-epimerase (non-hydrolyzing), partial [Oscillospiraceae bacterium]